MPLIGVAFLTATLLTAYVPADLAAAHHAAAWLRWGAAVAAVLAVAASYGNSLRLLAGATGCRWTRLAAAGVVLPVAWLFLGALTLVLLPVAVAYLVVVLLSLGP